MVDHEAAANEHNPYPRIVPRSRAVGRLLEMTPKQRAGLEVARTLIELGIPLFDFRKGSA